MNENSLKRGNVLLMKNAFLLDKQTTSAHRQIKLNNTRILDTKKEQQRVEEQLKSDIRKMADMRQDMLNLQKIAKNLKQTIVDYEQLLILKKEAAYLAQCNVQPKPVHERFGDIMPIPIKGIEASKT